MILRFLPLLWANLKRRRVRTILTIASVAIAFLLFGLLEALRYAIQGGVEMAGADRLMTSHKISFIMPLPRSYLARVRGIEDRLRNVWPAHACSMPRYGARRSMSPTNSGRRECPSSCRLTTVLHAPSIARSDGVVAGTPRRSGRNSDRAKRSWSTSGCAIRSSSHRSMALPDVDRARAMSVHGQYRRRLREGSASRPGSATSRATSMPGCRQVGVRQPRGCSPRRRRRTILDTVIGASYISATDRVRQEPPRAEVWRWLAPWLPRGHTPRRR